MLTTIGYLEAPHRLTLTRTVLFCRIASSCAGDAAVPVPMPGSPGTEIDLTGLSAILVKEERVENEEGVFWCQMFRFERRTP